jgi:hypothetical protein
MRRGQRRTFDSGLSGVVPEPCLLWLEALDNWVPGFFEVAGRMLTRGVVTTSDMPAFCTAPEVKPPCLVLFTFHATAPGWTLGRIDSFDVSHCF